MSVYDELLKKIETKTARIFVIGAGYVGLPLVIELLEAGFRVTAYDKDPIKARLLNQGESYIGDVPSSALLPHVQNQSLDATTDPSRLREADVAIICVPTPLNKTKDPDMRFIVSATEEIASYQHPGMLVILESTTYPGTTREVLLPRLTEGYEIGQDVFLAFSPERVDPGNQKYGIRNTPKVVGGMTPRCSQMIEALYSQIIDTVVPVSSPDAAEMAKLLENTFRAVNIALVNEVAMMSRKLGIDPWEVIHAAASKPFGYMPFYPGPGLGGHCIPVDPLYLSWRLRSLKFTARFIELADTINSSMPEYVVSRITDALNGHAKAVRGSKILIAGVAYKRDVSDLRESPAITIIQQLRELGADISYMDPHVPSLEEPSLALKMSRISPFSSFAPYDCVVIVTDHSAFDYERLFTEAKLIVDTRDALRKIATDRSKVVGL